MLLLGWFCRFFAADYESESYICWYQKNEWPMSKERILLGMSGGTDSSTAAILLQQQGYTVVGVTLRMFDHHQKPGAEPTFIADAQALAAKLGIEHFVVDVRNDFNELVVADLVNQYLTGRTPFPCAICNPLVKWKALFNLADRLNISKVATGHYVQMVQQSKQLYIASGADPDKDQAFFLWNLKTEWLPRIVFPLGGMHKTEVRAFAAINGFEQIAKQKESMGICFLPNGNYHQFIEKELINRGLVVGEGDFVDSNGQVIGKHKGFYHYTIGQRKGLDHGQNRPLFVIGTEATKNQVRLGNYDELFLMR
jgi:tRNA-uridine 2-sulfurtransferase